MIIPDHDIIKSIEKGDISIEPFLRHNLRSSSYCLTLSAEIIQLENVKHVITLSDQNSYPKSTVIKFSQTKPYILRAGEFVLSSTVERLGLSNSMTGFLSNISGLARLGINVLLSTHIASGFGLHNKRTIVLEIHNVSNNDIELVPGIRIAHLILAKNSTECLVGYDALHPQKYHKNKLSEYYKS